MTPLRLLLGILACYRLARLIAQDDGPLWIFARLREWAESKSLDEQGFYAAQCEQGDSARFARLLIDNRARRPWASFSDGLHCPYCVGMWMTLPVYILSRYPGWLSNSLLFSLAIAGGQAFLKGQDRNETLVALATAVNQADPNSGAPARPLPNIS